MEKKGNSSFKKIWEIIGNIIYYLILIPLVFITLMIVYQQITEPDKIPDIFGWKLFIILDKYMDESVQYGDLVFTKNIDYNELKLGDVIAFRNATNTVTIHRIKEIKEEYGKDFDTKEDRNIKYFIMHAIENETNDTKVVKDTKVEGILRHKLPYVRTYIVNNSKAYSSCWYNRCNFIYRYDLFIYS